MEDKLCPHCGEASPVDGYIKKNGVPKGKCFECRAKYYKEYNKSRYATPEKRKEELLRGREKYSRLFKSARQDRKRELIIQMGGKCSICGYNRSAAALDFDHIDPDTKTRTVSHLLANADPKFWEEAKEEAKKCRLVCSNCHREITYPGHEL